MNVCLMSYVPHYLVLRRIEVAVDSKCELNNAEIGGEMTSGLGDGIDEQVPYLAAKSPALRRIQLFQIFRKLQFGQTDLVPAVYNIVHFIQAQL